MESRKELFKAIIREFHCTDLPKAVPREEQLLAWCREIIPKGSPTTVSPQVVTITGPRRVGKTYLLYNIMEQFCREADLPLLRHRLLYIDFEDDRLSPFQEADLDSFLEGFYEVYPDNVDKDIVLFLDGVHHIKGWGPFVRRVLDNRGIRVFITGSSAHLPDLSGEGLISGRTISFKLMPLNFREYLTFKGVPPDGDLHVSGLRYKIRFLLDEYLVYGGFPEVVLSDLSSKLKVLKDHLDLVMYKDLVQEFSIRNIALLKALIKHLFTHVGFAVSINAFYHDLLAEFRISRDTVLEYVSYLERVELITLVPVFTDSDKTKLVNPRHVFCLDNGLWNAFSLRLAEDEERLAKNVIFQTLNKAGRQIFYWKAKRNVDFVFPDDGKLRGIGVSYGRELDPAATAGLQALRSAAGRRETDLLIITKDTEKAENGVRFTPLWKWLLEAR